MRSWPPLGPEKAVKRDYHGLESIARGLGVSRNTVLVWYKRAGLLMYRRRVWPHSVWYSNDTLITMWEVARCRVERQARLKAHRRAPG